ncbi:UbiA prenyltransferase family protein [Streptomyces sp. NPDC056358]|uniref:UbiA prenyltransferase family protein n=1 Tax=Streptomyces sp. NPDC056358 TaxID=3345794 RepID=UPI0035DCA6F7
MTVASQAPAQVPTPVPAPGRAARLVGRTPAGVRPYLELLRLDRPVGAWLLVVPGWIALGAIAGPRDGVLLGLLLLVYGVLSRGAACGLNDVLDARFDAQVPRTAGRPVASGRLAAGPSTGRCRWCTACSPEGSGSGAGCCTGRWSAGPWGRT